MKNHYVYLTTNLITGKQYIGDHTINSKERKYYIGSGVAFLDSVKSYGESIFFKEILEWFETRKEASSAQEKYIQQYNTLVPNGYNISPLGGLGISGCHSENTKNKIGSSNRGKQSWLGKHHTEESCKKISNSLKGKEVWNKGKTDIYSNETLKKISQTLKGKPNPHTKEQDIKIGLANRGKKRTDEQKKNIQKKLKGRIPWNKGKKNTQIAWNKGISFSDEVKQKMSQAKKGKIPWNKKINAQ